MNTITGKEVTERFKISLICKAQQELGYEINDDFKIEGRLDYDSSSVEDTLSVLIYDREKEESHEYDIDILKGCCDESYIESALGRLLDSLKLQRVSYVTIKESTSYEIKCSNECGVVVTGKNIDAPKFCPSCGEILDNDSIVKVGIRN